MYSTYHMHPCCGHNTQYNPVIPSAHMLAIAAPVQSYPPVAAAPTMRSYPVPQPVRPNITVPVPSNVPVFSMSATLNDRILQNVAKQTFEAFGFIQVDLEGAYTQDLSIEGRPRNENRSRSSVDVYDTPDTQLAKNTCKLLEQCTGVKVLEETMSELRHTQGQGLITENWHTDVGDYFTSVTTLYGPTTEFLPQSAATMHIPGNPEKLAKIQETHLLKNGPAFSPEQSGHTLQCAALPGTMFILAGRKSPSKIPPIVHRTPVTALNSDGTVKHPRLTSVMRFIPL